jgi:DNA-binding NtrC family response regulator
VGQHRITIAEDDTDAIFLLQKMIGEICPDCSISTFTNAEDALAHINATGTDILITNHGMGEMSGTQMIRILRAQRIKIPIIMVSGDPRVRDEAEEAGANTFIEKSLDTKAIRECILKLLPD